MFGLLFSMKSFVRTISPRRRSDTSNPTEALESEPFFSFQTKQYKLHYYETLTGLRIALTTDVTVGRINDTLRYIYRLFVDFVLKNPLYKPGYAAIQPTFFSQKIHSFLENLPFFN